MRKRRAKPAKWRTGSGLREPARARHHPNSEARFSGVSARLDTVRGAFEPLIVRSSWIILEAFVLRVVATGAQLSKVGGQSYVSIAWLVPRVRLAST